MKPYCWWEFALRAAAIAMLTAWYGTIFVVRRLLGSSSALSYTIIPRWARSILHAAGIRIHVRGAEHLRSDGTYILLANHCSLFDIPVLIAASPVPVRILYKRELERVPFLGWALRLSTFIAVERERPQTAGRTVQHVIASLSHDPAALVVFPEGTRSRTGKLGQFRRGAFAIALAAQRLLVPVVLRGTHQLLPPGTLRFNGGTVGVEFLEPIAPPTDELSRAEQRQWMERTRELFLSALSRESTLR